jgi:hypothetical protein
MARTGGSSHTPGSIVHRETPKGILAKTATTIRPNATVDSRSSARITDARESLASETSARLTLVLRRCTDVVMPQRTQVTVKLVDLRDAGWNIQTNDGLIRHVVQVLHERADAVAVSHDEDRLA